MEQIQDPKAVTACNISIPVVHNRIKNHQVTALHLMAAILFIVLGMLTWMMPHQTNEWNPEFWQAMGILLFTGGLAILLCAVFFNKKIIQNRIKNLGLRIFEILSFSAIITYSLSQKWYMPMAYSSAALIAIAFAFFWEKSSIRDFQIQLKEKGIMLPRFIANKFILWQDIEKVIFKFDLITIDCRDNKIYQFHIRPGQFTGPDLEKAHTFCSYKIEENKSLYREDW